MPVPNVTVIDQVSASMSMRSLEHRVIATNIANRDTEGYQRVKLQFDRALDGTQSMTLATQEQGEPVSIEHDVVALSANSVQYQGLARALGRYFSIISAITNPTRG